MKRTHVQSYTTATTGNMRVVESILATAFVFSFLFVGLIPFFIHAIPFALFLVHTYLTETNLAVDWSKSNDWYKGWMKYQSLPKEYRKAIKVSADEYYNYTDQQRGTFVNKINAIHENYIQRMAAKGLDEGLVARMDAILQADDHAIMVEREAKKELHRRGW